MHSPNPFAREYEGTILLIQFTCPFMKLVYGGNNVLGSNSEGVSLKMEW